MSRILIVDDEPMIAMMLADWVSELGHEAVGPSHNAHAALALIAESSPDAAIVDVSLGEGSGYPVAECLTERNIPLCLLPATRSKACPLALHQRRCSSNHSTLPDVNAAIDNMMARATAMF